MSSTDCRRDAKYEILFNEAIEEGSDGIVYRAIDMVNNKPVIIKSLFESDTNEVNNHLKMSAVTCGLVENEAHHLPFIPKLYEHLTDSNSIINMSDDWPIKTYIVMELIQGKTLYWSSRDKQDWDYNWIMVGKLLRIVQRLHNNGFYHDDIHSLNVMVTTCDDVYLIDFSKSGDLSSMRSDLERRTDVRVRSDYYQDLDTEGRAIVGLVDDYIQSIFMFDDMKDSKYSNVNHGLERYLLLQQFSENLECEEFDQDGNYVTYLDYGRLIIDEYDRLNDLSFS